MLGNAVYWLWEQGVSPEICEILINKTPWNQCEEGGIKDGKNLQHKHDADIRKTSVLWVDINSVVGAITQNFIRQANTSANWNFSINSFEPVQMTKYDSSVLAHYDWHMDMVRMGEDAYRKLTCVILLNDPSSFEGGELLIKTDEPEQNILLRQGSVVVFPSFMYHKVTPVTSGIRYSAVNWALGPAFR